MERLPKSRVTGILTKALGFFVDLGCALEAILVCFKFGITRKSRLPYIVYRRKKVLRQAFCASLN